MGVRCAHMAVDAINPTAAGVSILFADPNLSFPSVSALLGSDAICVDLDQCVEPDGSLASKCLTLLKDAEQKKVDVILAAKAVSFYEVPALNNFSVTLVEKPETELTGEDLANWVAGEISRAMGLDDEVKRGLRRARSVGKSVPGKVSAVHYESNLSKEQEKAFLDFVSGTTSKPKAALRPAFGLKKSSAAKPGQYFEKGLTQTRGSISVGGRNKMTAAAAKVAKAAKGNVLKAAASPKTMAAGISGAGPRRKAKA